MSTTFKIIKVGEGINMDHYSQFLLKCKKKHKIEYQKCVFFVTLQPMNEEKVAFLYVHIYHTFSKRSGEPNNWLCVITIHFRTDSGMASQLSSTTPLSPLILS